MLFKVRIQRNHGSLARNNEGLSRWSRIEEENCVWFTLTVHPFLYALGVKKQRRLRAHSVSEFLKQDDSIVCIGFCE